MRQTIFDALIVMAYNVGRDHGEKATMPVEEGRRVTLEALSKLVEHIDPGDLARPVERLFAGGTLSIGKETRNG